MTRTHLTSNREQLLLAILTSAGLLAATVGTAEEGIPIPPPEVGSPASEQATAVAVLAGGCFWGVQGVFQHLDGVQNAISGYAGGEAATAQYRMVGSGRTGHAEAVEVTFDPTKISYGEILRVFFSVAHDPTQLNRQGPDSGTQYRTAIFPQNADQAKIAEAYIDQLNDARVFDAAIVTKIEPDRPFYRAEDYHQDYLTLNPDQPYIVYNDLPKIENLKRLFPDMYREEPVLVGDAGIGG